MRTLESWLEFISTQHWQSIDMGLARMDVMIQRMSLAQPAPRVITIAGTNGKGSTCMACEALLLASGCRVGTTLSPHVRRFNERVRIDGVEVGDALLCEAFTAVEARREGLPLTYFEFSALAALWCFKQADVDVAILEIGLGGRLDAFNAIDANVAVITSIDLDHQQFLGTTREAIGAEKAGILRAGQHVVLGPNMPLSVHERCASLHLEPVQIGQQSACRVVAEPPATDATWSIFRGQQALATGLPYGQCAPQNLLLAYMAIQGVRATPLSDIADVAACLTLPGRLQIEHRDQRVWLLDVAHNPAGAEFLCQQLSMRGLVPRAIVCGMLSDKDHAGVFAAVDDYCHAPWWQLSTHGERGLSAQALAAKLPVNARPFDEIVCLIDELNSATQPGDVILLFGSFSVVEQFDLVRETTHDFER